MAGNFTALPVALLLMKNTYGVIKEQAPIAIVMTVSILDSCISGHFNGLFT